MKGYFLLSVLFTNAVLAQPAETKDVARWELQAKRVSIIRDHFGIPHVYGKTDADAVFGLLYAQCEDDFNRVEMNYIEKLGRLSEVHGEQTLFDDLLVRLVIDSSEAINDYHRSPDWLKRLCNAFADGINYFLYKNSDIKPALLTKFEPWFPLLWTDGSIGAISTAGITSSDLEDFFSGGHLSKYVSGRMKEPNGSNGFAFAPSVTASGNSILYINPHVTFYFRPEVHMVSEEGLNAYGAVTWGQFFVYQGFNENCGWMHTSSSADVSDAYVERILEENNERYYIYNNEKKKLKRKRIEIKYQTEKEEKIRGFDTWHTHHGPIMARGTDGFISVKANNRDMNGLIQSWMRTKAVGFESFRETMQMRANMSNNTVYADSKGNIAYWHGNFMPRRDTSYDWSMPVDGTTTVTEWQGLHEVEQTVHIYNPASGWIQNCNSTPFTAAGLSSPVRGDYPRYMAPDGENFRGINAARILGADKNYTIDKVIAKGYNRFLPAFEIIIPSLHKAYSSISNQDDRRRTMKDPVALLSSWDYRCGGNSIATTLAVFWGEELLSNILATDSGRETSEDFTMKTKKFAETASATLLLNALQNAMQRLEKDFGTWRIEWGNINRFQRISGEIQQQYADDKPSFPVPFVSATWGMLPAYHSSTMPNTKKRYGLHGNSFICAVEFGEKIKAKSLLAGGESGHPGSKHFNDQGAMYAQGKFKDVLYYKEDVMKHKESKYHPGEKK